MSELVAGQDWNEAKHQHPKGGSVRGTVVRVEPYGLWIELEVGFAGLLLVTEMAGAGPKRTEVYPQVGSKISATVVGYHEERNQFVLSQRAVKSEKSLMSVLTEDLKNKIRAYFPRYPRKQAVTLPALHLVHDELRHVPPEAVVEIAELLDLHPAEVQDAMTFYQFFKETEADRLGKDRVWVCRGLACMLRGAYELIDHCEAKLGVRCGQRTADGKITLEFAECVGACDGAPAVLLNDEHVMDVTPEKADQLFAELRK